MSSALLLFLVLSPSPSPAPLAPKEAVVSTAEGSFVIRLLPDLAPGHVRHFEDQVRAHAYDKTTFHRIIPGGIVQGGDPISKDPARSAEYGRGGLGLLKAEFSSHSFARGTVAAARRPSSVDSGGSQFFICLSDQPSLEGKYTVFGEVVEGMDVLDTIGKTPVEGDRPKERIEIQSVVLRVPSPSPAP